MAFVGAEKFSEIYITLHTENDMLESESSSDSLESESSSDSDEEPKLSSVVMHTMTVILLENYSLGLDKFRVIVNKFSIPVGPKRLAADRHRSATYWSPVRGSIPKITNKFNY